MSKCVADLSKTLHWRICNPFAMVGFALLVTPCTNQLRIRSASLSRCCSNEDSTNLYSIYDFWFERQSFAMANYR